MTFAEKFQALRRQNGWSQEQLAEKLSVSRQAISRWENGEVLPDAPNLIQISRLFGVSADYLLNDAYTSDADTPAVQNARAALEARRKLDSSFLAAVGVIATAALWQLANWLYEKSLLWMLVAFSVQMAAVIVFKVLLERGNVEESYRKQAKRKLFAAVLILTGWMVLLPAAATIIGFAIGIMAGHPGHYVPHTSLYDSILAFALWAAMSLGLLCWAHRHKDD